MQQNLYKIPANTKFIGKKIIYLPTCHSTNDIAAELSSQVEEGAVVITSNQTRGRGQRGNVWEAEAGANLTFSVVLKPTFLPASHQFYFNMAVALAITDVIASIFAAKNFDTSKLSIKWSNDIYYERLKLGGILIENTIENMNLKNSVVGIGININQAQFSYPTATSLKNILGQETELNEVLESLLNFLEIRYLALKNREYLSLKHDYMDKLYWYKEVHTYQDKQGAFFEGSITDIQESGRLVVSTQTGLRNFDFKEIVFYV